MNSQENLRRRLIFFLINEKVKQCEISESVKIPTDVLSKFKNGKKCLYDDSAEQLHIYLHSKNY